MVLSYRYVSAQATGSQPTDDLRDEKAKAPRENQRDCRWSLMTPAGCEILGHASTRERIGEVSMH